MDIRHIDPAEATEVTDELGEANPDKNKLYRVADRIYKATSHWLAASPALAPQRTIQVTASLCDATGQAVRDGDGQIILSPTHDLIVSAGLPQTPDAQIDEGTRRWIVAFHHITSFWDFTARGVAAKAAAPTLGEPSPPPGFAGAAAAMFGPPAA